MSYDNEEQQHMHRHQHHEHIDIKPVKVVDTSYRYYGYGICIFITIVLLFFVIIMSTNWYKVDHHYVENQNKFQQIMLQQHQQSHLNSFNDKIYSMSSVYQSDKTSTLSLCHLKLYYTITEAYNDSLRILTNPIQHLMADKINYFYYAIDLSINMDFNINKNNNPFPKIELDEDEKYLSFKYNLETNFNRFSTIKFIETSFDPNDKWIKNNREIILCSNNVDINSKQRCDTLNNEGNVHFTHTKVLTMIDNSNHNRIIRTKVTTPTKPNDNTPVPPHTKEPKEYDMDNKKQPLNGNKGSNEDDFKQRLDDIRLFSIVFYKEDQLNKSNQRPNQTNNGNTRGDRVFKESVILIVEPYKCN